MTSRITQVVGITAFSLISAGAQAALLMNDDFSQASVAEQVGGQLLINIAASSVSTATSPANTLASGLDRRISITGSGGPGISSIYVDPTSRTLIAESGPLVTGTWYVDYHSAALTGLNGALSFDLLNADFNGRTLSFTVTSGATLLGTMTGINALGTQTLALSAPLTANNLRLNLASSGPGLDFTLANLQLNSLPAPAAVPAPGALALISLGCFGIGFARRRVVPKAKV